MPLIFIPLLPVFSEFWLLSNNISQETFNVGLNLTSSISLTSELFTLITFALLICFLPLSFEASELFSKLGVYHPLSYFNSPFGETLWVKFVKVYFLNLKLSLFIFIVIFFFIATIIQFKEPLSSNDLSNLIISAIAICPAFLLSLRLLANPVKIVPEFSGKFKFLNRIFPVSYLARPNETSQSIRIIKERFVSLYFSMIITVLFTLIFLYVYLGTIYGSGIFTYISGLFIPSISKLNPLSTLLLIPVFLLVLFFTTSIGELFLRKYEVLEKDYGII